MVLHLQSQHFPESQLGLSITVCASYPGDQTTVVHDSFWAKFVVTLQHRMIHSLSSMVHIYRKNKTKQNKNNELIKNEDLHCTTSVKYHLT